MPSTILDINTIELHYCFFDNEHRMDAIIENKCEKELLDIMQEIISFYGCDLKIETELTQAGGIRKFFKFGDLTKQDKKSIKIAIISALLISIITECVIKPSSIMLSEVVKNTVEHILSDPELIQIQKEMAKEQLKELKLDNQKKQRDLDENAKIKEAKSNFYEILSDYGRLEKISFTELDDNKVAIVTQSEINKIDFDKYILHAEDLNDQVVENAKIVIVAPVLENRNIKWRGYYNGDLVLLTMKSYDFLTSVDEGLIEFKKGFVINCNLRIERTKNVNGTEKRKYIVTEVLSYMTDDTLCETAEGKRYKQMKK
jgi:hypothetical protein